jgi:hypothetical protein
MELQNAYLKRFQHIRALEFQLNVKFVDISKIGLRVLNIDNQVYTHSSPSHSRFRGTVSLKAVNNPPGVECFFIPVTSAMLFCQGEMNT